MVPKTEANKEIIKKDVKNLHEFNLLVTLFDWPGFFFSKKQIKSSFGGFGDKSSREKQRT